MKMPREEKAAWLYFLRSGEIQQAQGALMLADGSCCCIGVLCDRVLRLPKTLTSERINGESDDSTELYRFVMPRDPSDFQIQVLPTTLRDQYLTDTCTIDILELKDRQGKHQSLAQLNDDGLNFSQIADLIEYFVEALS